MLLQVSSPRDSPFAGLIKPVFIDPMDYTPVRSGFHKIRGITSFPGHPGKPRYILIQLVPGI